MRAHITRRGFLGVAGTAGATALLVACGTAPAPTAQPAGSASSAAPAGGSAAPTTAPASQPATATTAPAAGAAATKPAPGSVPAAQPATSSGNPVNILIHFSDAGNYGSFVTKYTADVISKKLPNYKIEVQGSPSHEENFTKM